ncbi:hypothetical protein BUALT_Bualt05G0086600 [Buddleja alternifolia]|uniref:Glycosyltransferase n=1 Tax=Buddleja alternifolia TaxID=168488 RepID=A0AAV6XHM8_9LAMI|nr:hypothetical protein BUALT_Bualt05G0086600 [Buddleja alternifolia]
MADTHRMPHAIMISVPYQGHINPFVNLALNLASKGFTITFVHLEYIHQTLSKAQQTNNFGKFVDLFTEARESGLDIRYTTISDGFPLEFDRDVHFEEYWKSIIDDFPTLVDDFVGRTIDSDSTPFLVTDTIYTWTSTIAHKYNLVNVSFWTQPALIFSLLYHWDLLTEKGHFPCKDNMEDEINYVPGVESISTRDLMLFLKEAESSSIVPKSLYIAFEQVNKADFILHNTVHELEPETLSVLNKNHPNYAIGPINFSNNLASYTVTKSLWSEADCTHWLNSKSPGSVLYVSFGSAVNANKQTIQEIGDGLLLSEVHFIWVVRASSDDGNMLLAEFKDEIKDRGLIVPWCNQIAVLSNSAVGGFLTHCGWNSIIESMWCGVPMICYPIAYDQPTNRKLVVDDWKIGISLCDGDSVDRKEVAEKIKNLMSGTSSRNLRQEAKKVQGIMRNAMEIEGSSRRNFDQFINDLKAKIHARTTASNRID